jgi:hypothetical protein
MRTPLSRSNQPGIRMARKNAPGTQGVADFLRAHDRMAALLPVAERLAALERDCAALLPVAYSASRVLHLDDGHLLLAVSNAALAAKLKQQLPKLQDGLAKRGWQVNVIRIKVQAGNISEKTRPAKQLVLPSPATQAFAELDRALDDSTGNQALKSALRTLLRRHGAPQG